MSRATVEKVPQVQGKSLLLMWELMDVCYVTVGTFTRRGLSSTAKTLRSLKGGSGLKSTKFEENLVSF